jgi:hypothetical protein
VSDFGVSKEKEYYKDYTFDDWINLDNDIKRDLVNHYWNPYEPNIGLKTRQNIIDSFKLAIKSELEYCKFRYFGFYAEAIFVIVKDPKVRLPRDFAGLVINRGKKLENLGDNIWLVKWNFSGKEKIKIE